MYAFLEDYKAITNKFLLDRIDQEFVASERLKSAMTYSLVNGGKRVRASLVFAAGCALGSDIAVLKFAAAALEMVHSFSLIHDDLPAIDNDDYRRGNLSCHKQFDEATAILAGDALHSLAFSVLLDMPVSNAVRVRCMKILSRAVGCQGLVSGECLDVEATGKIITLEQLKYIHQLKTSSLIKASVHMGCIISGCDDVNILQSLEQYAINIGLAFQIADDILDVEGSYEQIGKPVNADKEADKNTYPSMIGLENSKKQLEHLHDASIELLDVTGINFSQLKDLASFIIKRNC